MLKIKLSRLWRAYLVAIAASYLLSVIAAQRLIK